MTHDEKLDYDRLKLLEPELNEIYDSKTKGFQIMSETKLMENAEKNPEIILRSRKATSMSQCNKGIKTEQSKCNKLNKCNSR